jgi:hypothetical protein
MYPVHHVGANLSTAVAEVRGFDLGLGLTFDWVNGVKGVIILIIVVVLSHAVW